MYRIAECREHIYEHFHSSIECQKHFFDDSRRDDYASYYTAMYLLQDTTESLMAHRERGFSPDPLQAYIELWGVMQALVIQQDVIVKLYEVLMGKAFPQKSKNWRKVRDLRVQCTGHPIEKQRKNQLPERAFLGRNFGGYENLTFEVWRDEEGEPSHPRFPLAQMIDAYAEDANEHLKEATQAMLVRWPC